MPDSVTPRPYGVIPLEQARTMSGLEIFGGMREGRFPPPPIMRFLNGELAEVEFGRVVFHGAPTEDHYNPLGIVHGGYAATLLDSCMGCAVHTTLPAGRAYTTVEIKVNYLKAVRLDSGLLTATGTVVKAGSRVGFAEGTVTDDNGAVVATATSTLLIFDL